MATRTQHANRLRHAVLGALLCGEDQVIYLCHVTGYDRRHVVSTLNMLEAAGHVQIDRSTGRCTLVLDQFTH